MSPGLDRGMERLDLQTFSQVPLQLATQLRTTATLHGRTVLAVDRQEEQTLARKSALTHAEL